MPRNGSGTMSIPNSFSTNTTASSSAVNANFSDVAAEITGSLPRDGQAAMTAPLQAASGSAAAPSLTFASDTDTGFYRKSGNTMGVVAGGTEVATIDSTGYAAADGTASAPSIHFTNDPDTGFFWKAANTIGVTAGGTEVATIGATGFSTFPAGTVMLFAQTAAPTGWTKSTTHNDKALRVVSGTASSGGSTSFSSTFTNRTITQANLPNYNLTVNLSVSGGNFMSNEGAAQGTGAGTNFQRSGNFTAPSITGTVNSAGSGTAMGFAVQYVDVILATKD